MTLLGRRGDPSPKKFRLLGALMDFIGRGGRVIVDAFVAFLSNSFRRLRPHLAPMNLLLKIVVGVVVMILAGGILMPLFDRLGVFPTIIDRIERQAAYRWAADHVQKWRIDPMPPETYNILVADLAGDTWSGQQADRIVDALGDQFKVNNPRLKPQALSLY